MGNPAWPNARLTPLMEKIAAGTATFDDVALAGALIAIDQAANTETFLKNAIERQRAFDDKIAEAIGFDTDNAA